MSQIFVNTSHDSCEVFKKRKIVDSLLNETDVKEAEAMMIARSIELQVKKNKDQLTTTSQIRVLMNAQLYMRGDVKAARESERVGIPTIEIDYLINNHVNDNANLLRAPRTVEKFVADSALKQYALNKLPSDIALAHNKGDIRLHDLDYFATRPGNCMQADARWFIKEGLKIDGTGKHSSVAGPAKNLMTLVNQIGEVLLSQQQNLSGGQGLPLMNVFLAPFARGLKYNEIKQGMQMFIYNMNNAYVDRGSQTIFGSVGIEMGVPNFLKDYDAYGPNGKRVGVYEEFEEESRQLQRAFTEVMNEGDFLGKAHIFPNSLYNLRKEHMKKEFDEDWLKVHQLSSKFSVPYFINQEIGYNGVTSSTMGCRTSLGSNFTGDWEKDTLRTGNLAYSTINLPRLAYKTSDLSEFLEELEQIMNIVEEYLLLRRERVEALLNKKNLLPFLFQKNKEGETYYRIDTTSLAFGFVGMHETLLAMGIEDGVISKDGQSTTKIILQAMNDRVKDLREETNYRWGVFQTPAESAARDFALSDLKYYPKQAIINGDKDSAYYTNSSHVPVSSDILLPQRIKIESQFHPYTGAGAIMHGWLGEERSSPEGLLSLTKKIMNSKCSFFTYTSAYTHCFSCNTRMAGIQTECYACGSKEIESYDRVTGYMQKISGWNASKQREQQDRYRYEV